MAQKIEASALGDACVDQILETIKSYSLYQRKKHECQIHDDTKACQEIDKYNYQFIRESHLLDTYCRLDPK